MSKNLGKSLAESLKEQATNFTKWQSASQAILNGCNRLKKMSDSVEEVNDSLVELGKQNIKREPVALYSWRLIQHNRFSMEQYGISKLLF